MKKYLTNLDWSWWLWRFVEALGELGAGLVLSAWILIPTQALWDFSFEDQYPWLIVGLWLLCSLGYCSLKKWSLRWMLAQWEEEEENYHE